MQQAVERVAPHPTGAKDDAALGFSGKKNDDHVLGISSLFLFIGS